MLAFQIAGSSTTTAVNATPTNVAIPVDAAGQIPNYLLVVSDVHAEIKPVLSGDSSAVSTMARIPVAGYYVLQVKGFSHIRMSAAGGSGNVTLTPLENQ